MPGAASAAASQSQCLGTDGWMRSGRSSRSVQASARWGRREYPGDNEIRVSSTGRSLHQRDGDRSRLRESEEAATVLDDFPRTLDAARAGQDWAWRAIYQDLSPPVLGYLRGRGVSDAEDLAAEVFLQVVRDVVNFKGDQREFRGMGVRDRPPSTRRRSTTARPTAGRDQRRGAGGAGIECPSRGGGTRGARAPTHPSGDRRSPT